ncbi:translocation protein-related protein [Prunus dulcis]|uniref:Translocation protein SEC62 n=1 Tax=Prunus dulcis TaxID=3755 RepID=A0A4Y1RDC8_PRUDU|nr:translocation protein-related protein [Prunus dulcis]
MKKAGGAEKKRVRRSSGAIQNGGRDSNSDTPPRKQAIQKDVFQLFAEKVGCSTGDTRGIFQGKDFVRFLRNHPELKDILESDRNLEAEDIADVLLRKNLLVRCDRVVKTLRPGKKKLSTWPAHLEIFPDQVFSENDAFFAWTFVKRRPLWQTLLSFFWPVVTLAICLFPVYPHRGAIFGALYIILGKRVWFFPNILAEEATLRELFRFWPQKDEEERPKWTTRVFYAAVGVLVILLLRHHAPDEAARARYQKRVSNIIDDVLEWSPRLALSGMMENLQPVVNATEASNATEEGVTPPDGMGAETIREQDEAEVSENLENTDENLDNSEENLDNSGEQKHDI